MHHCPLSPLLTLLSTVRHGVKIRQIWLICSPFAYYSTIKTQKPASEQVFAFLVRPRRIELLSRPWQGRVLPLNHGRLLQYLYIPCPIYQFVCLAQDSFPTGTVYLADFAPPNARKVFESWAQASSAFSFALSGAPTRIRTWNNCFEGSDDIHFTIGAFPHSTLETAKNQ